MCYNKTCLSLSVTAINRIIRLPEPQRTETAVQAIWNDMIAQNPVPIQDPARFDNHSRLRGPAPAAGGNTDVAREARRAAQVAARAAARPQLPESLRVCVQDTVDQRLFG